METFVYENEAKLKTHPVGLSDQSSVQHSVKFGMMPGITH